MGSVKIAYICAVTALVFIVVFIVLLVLFSYFFTEEISQCDECDMLPTWLSTKKGIIEFNKDAEENYIVVPTNGQAKIFDYLFERKGVFWAVEEETGSTNIYRSWLHEAVRPYSQADIPIPVVGQLGGDPRVLAEAPTCGGLTVDWVHAHIYWALGPLEMATLDGSHRRLVYSNSAAVITGIAVDPLVQLLFWSEETIGKNKSRLQIKASTLRGSAVRIVIPYIDWPGQIPNNIIADVTQKRLYFLEKWEILSSCDYKGRSKKVVVRDQIIVAFTVSQNQLFWSRASTEIYTKLKQGDEAYLDLRICGECTNNEKDELYSPGFQIKVVDKQMQPAKNDQLSANDCLLNYTTFTEICPCPFGHKEKILGSTRNTASGECEEVGFLVASFDSIIQGVDPNGTTMTLHFKRNAKLTSVDFHFVKGLLFWFDSEDGRIYKAKMFQLADKFTVALQVRGLRDLAVDWIHDLLYWTYKTGVEVCRLDGGARLQLLSRNSWSNLVSITVDPLKGLMYLSNWTEGSIEVAALDGSQLRRLVPQGLKRPNSLTLLYNPKGRSWYGAVQLFWIEPETHQRLSSTIIKACFLQNGVSCWRVYRHQKRTGAAAMTLLNNRLYWLDHRNIYSIWNNVGSTIEKMELSGKHKVSYSLRAYHSKTQPMGTNNCLWQACPRGTLCLSSGPHSVRCVRKQSPRHYLHFV